MVWIYGRLKKLVTLGSVLVALTSATMMSSCDIANQPSRIVAPLPPQGLYEECPPADGARCLARLTQMASAGFELVLNYNLLDGPADKVVAYAQQAHTLGMKVIWPMNNPVFWNGTDVRRYFSDLARTCACSDNDGFIQYLVNLVKNLPGTWGYYVGDEVPSAYRRQVEALADLIGRLDPSHGRLYVAGADSISLGAPLAPFADTADVLGADYYPIGTTQSIEATAEIATSVQAIASRHNKQSMMVLQAFSWAQYPHEESRCSPFPDCASFPTKNDMQQMRDLVLRYSHPQLILWYSYYDIFRSDNPIAHWTDLVAAADPQRTTVSSA